MHFPLFDYQESAARDVLAKLVTARDIYRDPKYNKRGAFALSAVTGAGKTVIASAVIEAQHTEPPNSTNTSNMT